jgi:PPOX class probable F420-dependent enzyme
MGRAALVPWERALLDAERVGRLATVDERGRPHAVPVCYALLGDLVYSAVDEKPKHGDPLALRRIRNLLARPDVCLVADRYDEDWDRLAWVQVRGTAALVADRTERARALAALRARYPLYRTMRLEELPLIRIAPDRIVSWRATGAAPAARAPDRPLS